VFTETLARFAIETRASDLPDETIGAARDALIDTVGVALAGTREPVGELAARWARELGAKPQAACWGLDAASSPAEAAFVNGICSHALDFDDTHPSLRGHPSATLLPAALAVGEAAGASGEDVLAAYVIGMEIAGKLGRALGHSHYLRGWHSTATVGTLAATAVAARLYGLDAGSLRRAWGLAASQMSGLVRNFGTMTKPFHAGHAARCGVLSAWMAKNGFTANPEIFDARGGALDTYRGDQPGEAMGDLVRQLGRPWEIVEPGIYVKRWPCCYSSHRTIGGLFNLVSQHRLRAEEIGEVAIGFLPGGDVALVSRDPRTALEGKFSVEYAVAAVLLDGRLTLETFTDGMVQRPPARELIGKVRRYAIADDKLYSGITGYNDLAVRTSRGNFEVRIDKVPGSPAWPMTERDRTVKFIDCAARVLGTTGAERLLDLARRARSLPDIREVARATIPAAAIAAGLAAVAGPAHAHHVMDYATPATALEGLLSGLAHPVIGVDHLLFIAGAGVLAAQFKRGYLLPLVFVAASIAVAGMRYLGVDAGMNELWIAGSLAVLGAVMLAAWKPGGIAVAGLFLVAGALHGYALAEAIVGAERAPLLAYLAGLAVIECAIALAAWWIAASLAIRRPRVPLQRLVGAAVAVAGLAFAGVAAFG